MIFVNSWTTFLICVILISGHASTFVCLLNISYPWYSMDPIFLLVWGISFNGLSKIQNAPGTCSPYHLLRLNIWNVWIFRILARSLISNVSHVLGKETPLLWDKYSRCDATSSRGISLHWWNGQLCWWNQWHYIRTLTIGPDDYIYSVIWIPSWDKDG